MLRAIAAADRSQGRPKGTPSLQHSMLQPVQGLILDSAPCRLTPEISARSGWQHYFILHTISRTLSFGAIHCSTSFDGTHVAVSCLRVLRCCAPVPSPCTHMYWTVWWCMTLQHSSIQGLHSSSPVQASRGHRAAASEACLCIAAALYTCSAVSSHRE